MNREEFMKKAFIPIETISLTEKAAEEFIRRLYFPTPEESKRHNQIMEKIERDVKITKTEDGFIAEVMGLDLSFLDKI